MAQGLGEGLTLRDGLDTFGAVVEVVSQRGVDDCQRQVVLSGNLVRASAKPLVPNGDISPGDLVAGHAGLATRDPRRHLDIIGVASWSACAGSFGCSRGLHFPRLTNKLFSGGPCGA